MNIKLSNNFFLYEFLRSKTALRMRYNEQFEPDVDVIENLSSLCNNILQPVRDRISESMPTSKISIEITSGYRCPRVNKRIGGSKNSFHSYGMAADCELYVNGIESNRLLFDTILNMTKSGDIIFAECIYEFGSYDKDTKIGEPDWVHIAYSKGRNSCKTLRAVRGKTKTLYKKWKF